MKFCADLGAEPLLAKREHVARFVRHLTVKSVPNFSSGREGGGEGRGDGEVFKASTLLKLAAFGAKKAKRKATKAAKGE